MNITTTYDEAMVKAMIAEAVAKEREECAKVCENKGLVWKSRENINPEVAEKAYMASTFIAAAIRNRSST